MLDALWLSHLYITARLCKQLEAQSPICPCQTQPSTDLARIRWETASFLLILMLASLVGRQLSLPDGLSTAPG